MLGFQYAPHLVYAALGINTGSDLCYANVPPSYILASFLPFTLLLFKEFRFRGLGVFICVGVMYMYCIYIGGYYVGGGLPDGAGI